MHRVIRDHLEEVLAESPAGRGPSQAMTAGLNRNQDFELHLRQCEECRTEIEFIRKQAVLLRQLRTEVEPPPGFYARVIGRIEAQRGVSIWSVFSESPFGKRIAMASMTLALVFGIYLIASESYPDQVAPVQVMSNMLPDPLPDEDQAGMVLGSAGAPDREAVLVNLVTYREQ
jgi:predicted anti-sigma-YlaC factor YlaD